VSAQPVHRPVHSRGWTPQRATERLSEPFDRTEGITREGSRGIARGQRGWHLVSVTEIAPRGDEFERTPPHDLAAEQCVLGGMMLSKDAISDVLEVIRPADHYRPAHQLVHEVILDLYGRGEPADAVTVAAELTKRGEIARVGGAPYLHTLIASVPTAANAGYYARIVRERAILRRLVEVGTRIVQLGYSGDGDADELVDRAEAEVYGVTERRVSDDYLPLSEIMPGALDEIEAIGSRGGALTGVPTGFADLDALTNGLHPGQMIVIAARPALGKSTLALDLARAASIRHGLTSAIFSLEMSRNEITMRLLSAEARVPLHSMRTGQLGDEDWTRLARRMSEVVDAPLFIDDSPNMSMMEIRAKCRRMKQRHDLRLVIIDYLQLMTSPKRVENRQQEVSEMSRSLKLLAKELEVPVIAVAQLNRGPEQRTDKRPLLADLRESGCLTRDATLLRADTGAPITFGTLLDHGHEGILVWSLDEKRRLVASPVTNVFPSGVKDTYRLRLASGREVKATGNHPFLTLGGWNALDSLAVGDRIAIPRRLPAPVNVGLGWSEHRLGLLAHLIGDGCVLRKQPVHYTSNDEANLDFVEAAAAAEFGITPRRVQQSRWWHTYLPAPYRCARGRRNPLHVWFGELGIEDLRSHEKRIPDALYCASEDELAIFLRHLWATDGNVTPSAMRATAPKVYYATTSRVLADGVALLLSRFGILARIRQVTKRGYRPGYHVIVADGPGMRTFCRRIGVHGRRGELVPRLFAAINGKATNTNVSDLLREAASDDVHWDRIVAIEPTGPQPVFDATVKGTHNFIANGISVHNSIEQDSDVVILLHREDAYERESPRAGEADFIVAKHRNGPTATVTVAFQGHYSRFVDMAPV
jgi:replicative DNA helicase